MIWLSTLNAWPGIEKLLVIRCVVPPTVSTPATVTASQNSATSALWRSTKRGSEGIGISRGSCPGGRSTRHPQGCRSRLSTSSCVRCHLRYRLGRPGGGLLLPQEYPERQPRDGDQAPGRI